MIVKIVERDNMERAFNEVLRNLEEPRKSKMHSKREIVLSYLKKEIEAGTFRLRCYREMKVREGEKVRNVSSPCVVDRIGCNAIMRVVEEKVYPSVIYTSAASIPGRGMHRLFAKMRCDIEKDREGTLYYYKCDMRKFYESIDQEICGVLFAAR